MEERHAAAILALAKQHKVTVEEMEKDVMALGSQMAEKERMEWQVKIDDLENNLTRVRSESKLELGNPSSFWKLCVLQSEGCSRFKQIRN